MVATASGSSRRCTSAVGLLGLGWMVVSASGALLERSIVDRMVGGAERLVFEGGPMLVPPLQAGQGEPAPRRRRWRRARYGGGVPAAVDRRDGQARGAEGEGAAAARARDGKGASGIRRARKQRASPSAPASRSRPPSRRSSRQCEGRTAARCRVAVRRSRNWLATPSATCLPTPQRFEGETLADPLEGVDYGRCVAKIMRRSDGTPWIHSFAHGRTIYELKLDAATVRRAMEGAAKSDVV